MGGTRGRLRVPRSPAVFVGRERELARTVELVARSGVAVITGVGGLGKTSLACRAVEELEATETAVFVDVAPGAPLALEVGRALARCEGFATADWSAFTSDPEAMLDAVLDLAESSGRLVLVDDLHDAAEGADEALHALTRSCRRSRWLVTSRRAPSWPGSEEHTVTLSPLGDDDLEQIVAACAPHVAQVERRAIARAAHGSPWTARSRLRAGARGAVLTDGLAAAERELLGLLALVGAAVPPDLLCAHGAATAATLDALRRNGLLEPGDDVRLHDVARTQLEDGDLPVPGDDDVARLAAALGESGVPELELEAVALLRARRVGGVEAVARGVAHVEAWIEAGLAERAFTVLEGEDDPRVLAARLQCAAALGTEATLAWAGRTPEPTDPTARLWWATAHERAGHFALAARAARAVRELGGDPDRAAQAALVEAEALRVGGFPAEAEAVLADAAPRERGLALLVEARLGMVLSALGRIDEGLARGRRALAQADHLPPLWRIEVATTVQTMLSVLGHLADGRAITRKIELDRVRAPFLSRQQMAVRCIDALEAGDLVEGRRWLDRLGDTRGSRGRVHVLLDELRWRGAVGCFEGFDAILAELSELCEVSGNAENLAWARVAEAFFGLVLGVATLTPWPEHLPAPRTTLATAMAACQRMVRRRAGATIPPPGETSPVVDVAIFLGRDRCEAQLLGGDHEAARRTVVDVLEHARRHGFHLHAADLLALGIDVHLASRGPGEAARRGALRYARDLAEAAEHLGSSRYALEAELGALLAGGAPPPREHLERLAGAGAISPIAARRASALAGLPVHLDALDRAVLGRMLDQLGAATADDAAEQGGTAWRFDATERRVFLPARIIELRKHALLVKLLGTLAAGGHGGASKEDLARAVWELRDYHPLRDDKRLHVAVRRLRVLLEDDAERPERIVTTDDGYALRGLAERPRHRV